MKTSACRECGAAFQGQRSSREFCSASCKKRFNNRRLSRGAAMYDIFMSIRFARKDAKEAGARKLLDRLAGSYKLKDDRDRNGLPSWNDINETKARLVRVLATVVGVNVAGTHRRHK